MAKLSVVKASGPVQWPGKTLPLAGGSVCVGAGVPDTTVTGTGRVVNGGGAGVGVGDGVGLGDGLGEGLGDGLGLGAGVGVGEPEPPPQAASANAAANRGDHFKKDLPVIERN